MSEAESGGADRAAAAPRATLTSVAAVLVALGALAAFYLITREQPLTILVVSMDTTRPDHLSPYGYDAETSPHLARLAREGTVFTNARSTSSWTLPSHMSLFTGLPADLHDVTIDFQMLDDSRRTLGEIFAEQGFRTFGLYTAPYVHERFGFGRGMEYYEQGTEFPMAYDLSPGQMNKELGLREAISHGELTSQRVSKRARTFLRNQADERNLLFLHFFDPHYDFHAPGPLVKQFADPTYHGPIDGKRVTSSPELIHPDMPADDLAHLLALYDAELRWTDEHIGLVIQELEQSGRLEDTLIVVVSDHGEEFFEADRIGHRMTLREEVLRIPLIFWGPGRIPEGRVVDAEVALYDVLPTLMDYAGLPPDPKIYGRSLRPLMEGGQLEPRPTTHALTFLHADGPDYFTRHDAAVLDGLKYVRRIQVPWSSEDPTRLDNEPDLDSAEIEVFDLSEDPLERNNLWAPGSTDPRVRRIVQAFQDEQAAQLDFLRSVFQGRAGQTRELDWQQILNETRAVGYLGNDAAPPAAPAPGAASPGQDG